MLENKENRTLTRLGARVISPEEYELVTAGIMRSLPCTIKPKPGGGCIHEGDCEPPPAC